MLQSFKSPKTQSFISASTDSTNLSKETSSSESTSPLIPSSTENKPVLLADGTTDESSASTSDATVVKEPGAGNTPSTSGPRPSISINSIFAAAAAAAAEKALEMIPDSEKTDEQRGIFKRGELLVGFAPVKKKRTYYAVLSKRAFELHDSEKSYNKGTTAKHIVDLAVAFNVHLDHYDPKLKRCLCLMGPDETIVMRVEGKEAMNDWYQSLLQSLLPARQMRLGRPVFLYEIFESVYDVEVVPHTGNASKYNKSREKAGYTNICEHIKELQGMKRLCFYSHTVVLANRRIEPTSSGCPEIGFPPFRSDSVIEFPRPHIAFFGCHDRYFFLRLGKGIAIGSTELLVLCETRETATAIHQKMNSIIEREAGRRSQMGLTAAMQTLLQQKSSHRSRSNTHTSSEHKRQDSCGEGGFINSPLAQPSPGMESLSVPSPHLHNRHNHFSLCAKPTLSAKDRRLLLRDCISFTSSMERDDSAPSSPFGNSCRPRGSLGNFPLDHFSRLDQPRGSVHSLCGLPSESTSNSNGGASSSGGSSSRHRRPSNTIRMVKEEPGFRELMIAARGPIPVPKKLSSQSDCGPVTDSGDASRKTSTATSEKLENRPNNLELSKQNGSTNSLNKKALEKSPPAYSTIMDTDGNKTKEHPKKLEPSLSAQRKKLTLNLPNCNNDQNYSQMLPSDWNYGQNAHLIVPLPYIGRDEKYNLEEVRSYFSDSTDSCYSSLANVTAPPPAAVNAPSSRANSFGGKTSEDPAKPDEKSNLEKMKGKNKEKSSSSKDDPRKRAFSLGSKNFFNYNFSSLIGLNEFRRLVKKPSKNRNNSPSYTSSGLSLNSSTASPSSSSTNFLMSSDDLRYRSGSFGSGGRCSPFGRPTYTPILSPVSHSAHAHRKEDLDEQMEIDFNTMTICKPGTSIDSPMRPPRREDRYAQPNFSLLKDLPHLRPSGKILVEHRKSTGNGEIPIFDPPLHPSAYEAKRKLENSGLIIQDHHRRKPERGMRRYEPTYDMGPRRDRDDMKRKEETLISHFANRIGSITEEAEDYDSSTENDDNDTSDTKTVVESENVNDNRYSFEDEKNIPSTSTSGPRLNNYYH